MEGEHLLVDFFGVEPEICRDYDSLISVGKDIARLLQAEVLETIHNIHKPPYPGCSVILNLNKSHVTFHTSSVHRIIAIDVFCCSVQGIESKVFPLLKDNFAFTDFSKCCVERMKKGGCKL